MMKFYLFFAVFVLIYPVHAALPTPDKSVLNKCEEWFKSERERRQDLNWEYWMKKNTTEAGIKGPDIEEMYFQNHLNREDISLAQSIDGLAYGDKPVEGGLVKWCADMSDVFIKNKDPTGENQLCQYDLNWFCREYLGPEKDAKYDEG